jgi:hypothetical protein
LWRGEIAFGIAFSFYGQFVQAQQNLRSIWNIRPTGVLQVSRSARKCITFLPRNTTTADAHLLAVHALSSLGSAANQSPMAKINAART